jgi:Zn-dependent M16 (insulinase) family peptidase
MSSRGVRSSATRPADSIPGGDPQRIPDLTYPDFKAFHRRYYHPSNARFGDDDSDERLRLPDWWLRAFDPIAINSTVTLQKRSRAAAIAAGLHCGCGEARRKRESYGDGQLDD